MLLLVACCYHLQAATPCMLATSFCKYYQLIAATTCWLHTFACCYHLLAATACYLVLFGCATTPLLRLLAWWHIFYLLHLPPHACCYFLLAATTYLQLPVRKNYLMPAANAYVLLEFTCCYHLIVATACLLLPFPWATTCFTLMLVC